MQTGITTTGKPAYQFNSNADNPSRYVNLPKLYAVPPGMQLGVWHELIIHAHWATDSSGKIDAWHRVKGQICLDEDRVVVRLPDLAGKPRRELPREHDRHDRRLSGLVVSADLGLARRVQQVSLLRRRCREPSVSETPVGHHP